MKPRHLTMAVALVAAAWLALFGDKSPANGVAEPVVHPSPTPVHAAPPARRGQRVTSRNSAAATEAHVLALIPRDRLIGGDHTDIPPGPGLFASQSWAPPPPPPMPPSRRLLPPPPTAPPLPFTYLGKMEHDNTWDVYLARGDRTYIARDKEVIDDTYRVDAITPPLISFTYLPLNQAQTLTIGGTD